MCTSSHFSSTIVESHRLTAGDDGRGTALGAHIALNIRYKAALTITPTGQTQELRVMVSECGACGACGGVAKRGRGEEKQRNSQYIRRRLGYIVVIIYFCHESW